MDDTRELSFYEAVGGEETFRRLTRLFYEGVAGDPALRAVYPSKDLGPAEEHLRLFLIQYWGGPATYNELRGHPRLRMRHRHFVIGEAERDAWLRHMRAALDEIGLEPALDAQLWDYLVMAANSLINAPTGPGRPDLGLSQPDLPRASPDLSAGQLAVGDRVRPGRLRAEPLDLVLLVGLGCPRTRTSSSRPPRPGCAWRCGQEPPVVAGDHRAAGNSSGPLQRARVSIRSFAGSSSGSGLPPWRKVSARLTRPRSPPDIIPVASVVRALGTERGRRPGWGSPLPPGSWILRRRWPPDVLGRVVGPQLVHVGDLDGVTDLDVARVRLLVAHDHLEQRGLADPFGPITPTSPLRGSEAQPVVSTRSSKPLARSVRLDHLAAQPGARRDLDLLESQACGAVRLGRHLLVPLSRARLLDWQARGRSGPISSSSARCAASPSRPRP
jgi:hemoglobin